MANEAEKKAARRKAAVWKWYGGTAAVATIIYIVTGSFFWKQPLVSGFWHGVGLALVGLCYFMCIQGKLAEAAAGTDGEVWLDLFAVTLLVHIGHPLSKWAWLFLLAWPAYGLWLIWGFVKPYLDQYRYSQMQDAIHQAAVAVNKEDKAKRQSHGRKVELKRA